MTRNLAGAFKRDLSWLVVRCQPPARRRGTAAACTVMIFVLSLAACGNPKPITRSWTEDVLLEDGSTIVVKRSATFDETNSWSGDAYNAVERDATIAFTGALSNLTAWRAALMAIVMYRDSATSEWVIVAMTTSSRVWRARGSPCPEYWEFRLSGKGWHETPLSASSIGREANLLHRYQDPLPHSHITVADRETLESDPYIVKSFRKILDAEESKCSKRPSTPESSPSR